MAGAAEISWARLKCGAILAFISDHQPYRQQIFIQLRDSMPDALTAITTFINSPPGQLAAGAALGGIVWKFFERVEAVLTDNTKLEIAVWLLDRKKLSPTFESWPSTFAMVFDRIFGKKHLSLVCLFRSALATCACFFLALLIVGGPGRSILGLTEWRWWLYVPLVPLFTTVIPDYVSLLETRFLLRVMQRRRKHAFWITLLLVDVIFTGLTGIVGIDLGPEVMGIILPGSHASHLRLEVQHLLPTIKGFLAMAFFPSGSERVYGRAFLAFWLPCFFTSIWLWLYAGSGLILIAAHRFDIGFDWFSRHFDIEKKPLQSIGLVSGALVAFIYWSVALASRLL